MIVVLASLLNSQLNFHSRHAAHILTLNINVSWRGTTGLRWGVLVVELEKGGGSFYFNTVKEDEEVFKTHARWTLIPFKDI